jgi:hypothetical protein
MHYFDIPSYRESLRFQLTDEQKLELARRRAADDLTKILMKNAEFHVDKDGNVRGTINIPETLDA